jgi:hypothetical protein
MEKQGIWLIAAETAAEDIWDNLVEEMNKYILFPSINS